jgi:branched-chain amino acid transport system ATP-binding protein
MCISNEEGMVMSGASTPLLTIDGLRSGYGDAIVVDGCSLSIERGEAVALLGRNGVGKTTLLVTLMGLARVRGGSMQWMGRDLVRMRASDRARAGIGWVPQEREVFPSLTVEENLVVTALPGPWSLQRVYGLFPRLAERRRNFGNELSGGEQQMLAMGRALMLNPKLLLLDEPLEGLAPVIVEELCAAIKVMVTSEGQALILVEQHVEQALSLTHRAIVLERGRIVHEGSSEALLANPHALDRWIGMRVE